MIGFEEFDESSEAKVGGEGLELVGPEVEMPGAKLAEKGDWVPDFDAGEVGDDEGAAHDCSHDNEAVRGFSRERGRRRGA